ncbi:MAG TPA: metalloregulator ArsR/SmtB family transcription factor [Ramlibacter sp.]|nr:metalloregulator ArsR/SmtB family transcription factor [Ramlibacter sp.]
MQPHAAVLDRVFAALSDETRRGIVEHLLRGPATVSELAHPHGMSLPGFMKHLRVLEDAGLVLREKEGRVVRCELAAEPMKDAAMWLAHYEKFWNRRFDALGRFLYHKEQVDPWPKPHERPTPSKSKDATTRRPRGSGKRGPTRGR